MMLLCVFSLPGTLLAPILRATVDDDWTGVQLADGRVVRLPTPWVPALAGAAPTARHGWEVVGGGCAIRWPAAGELIVLHAIGESPPPAPRASQQPLAQATEVARLARYLLAPADRNS
jgi:Protein of unknown function (DUF2442)